MKSAFVLFIAAAMLTPMASIAAQVVPSFVRAAIADPQRPAKDTAADALRDPADTLAFAGVKPGMSIVEMFPGGGYYTRLLSKIVGPKGHVLGIENAGWKEAFSADQAVLREPGRTSVQMKAEPFGEVEVPRPVDMVWITQNYHDLKVAEFGHVDMAAFNEKVFKALKPGGVYFILDHQANPGTTLAQTGKLHRVEKAQVIKEVTAAGFKLVDEGSFLHRGDDDHTKPIFDLKGKTDQYALKFIKPAS
ncbi:MAG TPA: methyltransferase [Rhodanobacter sp.]|jgi:predicted methyltransferase|nr:methyltransferase [Rhodanobacter sp.]